MFIQGYSFVPGGQHAPQVATQGIWQQQPDQQQQGAPADPLPPLPSEAPPPLPDEPPPATLLQQQPAAQSWSQPQWEQAAAPSQQQQWQPQQPQQHQQWQPQPQQQWQPQQQQQWQPQQQQSWQPQQPQQQQQWQLTQQQWGQTSATQQWQQPQQQQWQQQPQQQQWQQQPQQQWGQGASTMQQWQQPQQWNQSTTAQQQWGDAMQQPSMQAQYQQQQSQQSGQQLQLYSQQVPAQTWQQPQQQPVVALNDGSWTDMYPQQQAMAQHNAADMQLQQQQQEQPGSLQPTTMPGNSGMNGAGLALQQPPPPPGPSPAAAAAAVAAAAAAEVPAPPPQPPSPPKPLDLSQLLLPPGRDSRPRRLLLLLRGLPGCGKSHLAKTIRALEVSAGGAAPRTHSIDDYFMVDVEKDAEEAAAAGGAVGGTAGVSASSSAARGSKRRGSSSVVVVQEYQHDPQLEGSYWKSLLRAVGKTLSAGSYPLVLLDAPALRGEQVREVWHTAQGAGAELVVVNPLTSDPEVCFKQNVHNHSLDYIKSQAKLLEPSPATFTTADATSLFEGGAVSGSSKPSSSAAAAISDVDMAVDEADDESAAAGGRRNAAAAGDGGCGSGGGVSPKASKPSSRWEEEDVGQHQATHTQHSGLSRDSAAHGPGSSSSAAAARPKKKVRVSEEVALEIDAASLLAGVNQELELLDAAEGAAAAGGAGRAGGGVPSSGTPKGLRSMSLGGTNSSGGSSGGSRVRGILKKAEVTPSSRGVNKVRVRWPDLPHDNQDQQQQQGFSIAAPPRQLAEVYWVEGLGPAKELWMPPEPQAGGLSAASAAADADQAAGTRVRQSFAAQVRAEHQAEHDFLFRAVLLGQQSTPTAGSADAAPRVSAGTTATGSLMVRRL